MSTFPTSAGVRQGGPESPFLFNLFIDFVMREFMEKCAKVGIKFFEHKFRINGKTISREERLNLRHLNQKLNGTSIIPWCGYADDLILFMLDQIGLQRATEILDEVFTKFGVSINISKTETMIISHKYALSDDYPSSIITELRGTSLNNVKEFKYLGSNIFYDEPSTGDVELNHRIQMANAKFAQMSNLLQNFKISLCTRICFLNSFVRSRLTYSCQNWNLKSSQYERLDVVYRLFLRRMVRGGFRRCGDCDNEFKFKLTKEKIHSICATSDVSKFIKIQQSNYAGHLIRTTADRSTKKLLFNDDKYTKTGRVVPNLLEQVVQNTNTTIETFCNNAIGKKHGNRR